MKTEKLITEKGKSYWANNGAYSTLLDEKWNELVPSSGNAETLHGELIRCFGRLNYEFGNNGNCNAINFTKDTCHSCCGDGYEERDCYSCDGGKIYDEDTEEESDCTECDGLGYTTENCYNCDGDGEIEEDISIDDYYQDMIDFLIINLPDSTSVENLQDFLVDKNKGYSRYKFDENEMAIYNAVGDAVGHFILNNPNNSLLNH
jgi:hypothetical protein